MYFYAYWRASYLLLLLIPSVIDYYCAVRIENNDARPAVRQFWLWVSIVTNIGLLCYFKYTNFLIDNISALLGRPIAHLNILLPVGISFYTFKTLSYTIDVYRRELKACHNLWKYAMFVTYFPELVAGPIVRASIFLPQMSRSLKPSWARTAVGLEVVLLGVTKKLLIADRLSGFVDSVFAYPQGYSPWTVTTAVLSYSLQIYCDFSGYSDIAIGVSKIIGFDLPENFNMPYLSTSVVEFWRRWHMTLSAWLRDYLYIPLGGNRHGRLNTYRNLMLTMLLGGLWHGASWNFVFWGLLHGSALAVSHWWTRDRPGGRLKVESRPQSMPVTIAKWAVTYVFVCITWVFFRSKNFGTSLIILRKLLWVDQTGASWVYSPFYFLIPLVILAHIFGVLAARQRKTVRQNMRNIPAPGWLAPLYQGSRYAFNPSPVAGIYTLLPLPGYTGGLILTAWLIGLFLFASLDTSPFIYFQF